MLIRFEIPMLEKGEKTGTLFTVEGSSAFEVYGLTFAAHRHVDPFTGVPNRSTGWAVSETSQGFRVCMGNTRRMTVSLAKRLLTEAGRENVNDRFLTAKKLRKKIKFSQKQ